MRIAAVQFHIDFDDQESDWTRAEEFMLKASQDNVDLIVFPEYFIGGPVKPMVEKNPLGRFGKLARKYQMDIVPGTILQKDEKSDLKYNTAYYIDQSGDVLVSYRKVHLWHTERSIMEKGTDGFPTCKNRFGVEVGLCICWDIVFPRCFTEMTKNKKAELIIAPAMWSYEDAKEIGLSHDPLSEAKLINSMATARCFENGIVFVFCNSASEGETERPQYFGNMVGRSQITVPFKGPVAHSDHAREEMISADVDIKKITEDAEKVYWIRKDWDEDYAGSKI